MSGKIKVLIIAYYWPPSGGSSVQRCLKWAQYLPEFGIQPYILTVDENYATYPFIDQTLLEEVPSSLHITKTRTSEPFWIYKRTVGKGNVPAAGFANESQPTLLQKFARFVRGNLFIPDPRKAWNKYAIPAAQELIKRENISVILTSSPPHSTQLIGLEIKKQNKNIKWIVDFADAWTDIYWYKELRHLPFAKKKDAEYERNVLEKADCLITISDLLKEQFLKKTPENISGKFSVIHNGYDEKDFTEASNPPKDKFVISYIGTMADIYKPQIFFKVIKQLLQTEKELPLVIRFVGQISAGVMAEIKELGLAGYCEETGYVSHDKAVSYLMQSTVLLLIIPDFANDKGNLPGKLYEYLASQKPIINIGPVDSESAVIIKKCIAGETFNRTMKVQLKNWLQQKVDAWKNNPDLDIKTQDKNYEEYSRKNQTGTLAQIIKDVL